MIEKEGRNPESFGQSLKWRFDPIAPPARNCCIPHIPADPCVDSWTFHSIRIALAIGPEMQLP
jgi:hypothetical protein